MKMKRYIFITMALLALVSCTKDSVKEVSRGQVIDFHTAMTRASVTTTDNLQTIWVTATNESETNYYTDLQYNRNGNYFTSETSYYWPSDGSTLDFYAYAPSKDRLGGTLSIDKTAQTLTGFAPAAEISNQVDFIVANASGSKENAETGVGLIFDHALTQVEIKGLNSNAGYTYKVKGVRIAQVASSGDFDFHTKLWTPSANKTEYKVEYAEARTLGTEAISLMSTDGDNAMLIPQKLIPWDTDEKGNESEGAFIAVLVNITSSAGTQVFPSEAEEYEWIATPIDTDWVRGFRYTYTLDLREGGLVAPDVDPVDPEDPDPFGPGEEVLGGTVKFTSSHTSWTWQYPAI